MIAGEAPIGRTSVERTIDDQIWLRGGKQLDIVDQALAGAQAQDLSLTIGDGLVYVLERNGKLKSGPPGFCSFVAVKPVCCGAIVTMRIDQFKTAAGVGG